MQQTTNTIVLVRPQSFKGNAQTAVNNYFQQQDATVLPQSIQTNALAEFDNFVKQLNAVGVNTIVIEDTDEYDTPDAIFPNNWISFHQDGTVAIYPLFAENRRLERREDVLDIVEQNGFTIENVVDYSSAEDEGYFLEGTGSMILDRANKKAYCALSPRADEELFIEFCEDFEYTPIIFTAYQTVDGERKPIYHTNVMLCIGESLVIACVNSIDDKKERKQFIKSVKEDGRALLAISEKQVHQFAGNMLEVKGADGKAYLVMSTTAFESLTAPQIYTIEQHCTILHSAIPTIERFGGGSVRCMMAEVFLPKG